MKVEDAAQFSKNNHFMITADRGGSKKHGCYFCITVVEREEITEWWDDGKTAVCPHCGIDAILPYTIDEGFLAECNKHWFTGRLVRYNAKDTELETKGFDTLAKLKILETRKNIYNIHYCKAGVGIVFFYPIHVAKAEWLNGLNCKRYYPTFEECIEAEYRAEVGEQTVEAVPIRADHHVDRAYIDGHIDLRAPVYEYRYVRADTVVTLGIEVNNDVACGWEVDGDMVVGHRDLSDIYIQRMRKEKAKG